MPLHFCPCVMPVGHWGLWISMQFCGMVGVMSRIGLADFVDESMKMIGVDKWLVRFHWWEHKCDHCQWIGLSISLCCGITNKLNYETLVDHACSLELAMVAPLASLSCCGCHRCHVGWSQTQSIASSYCRPHQILVIWIPCSVQHTLVN